MVSIFKTAEDIEKEAAAIYLQLGGLATAIPNLRAVDGSGALPDETLRWLGELSAIISDLGLPLDVADLRVQTERLIGSQGGAGYVTAIKAILYRALATAQRKAPAPSQSAFITTGADFDAFVAIRKIFAEATNSILIVDPYMDASVVTDFAILANDNVIVALLTDEGGMRESLPVAAKKWIEQNGSGRPLRVRQASKRLLHDRLILVDTDKAWIMTQSLKDFAGRSPATIQKVDPALAAMKFAAYHEIWEASAVVAETASATE